MCYDRLIDCVVVTVDALCVTDADVGKVVSVTSKAPELSTQSVSSLSLPAAVPSGNRSD